MPPWALAFVADPTAAVHSLHELLTGRLKGNPHHILTLRLCQSVFHHFLIHLKGHRPLLPDRDVLIGKGEEIIRENENKEHIKTAPLANKLIWCQRPRNGFEFSGAREQVGKLCCGWLRGSS